MPKPLIIEESRDGLDWTALAVKQAATIFGGAAVLGAIALLGLGFKSGAVKPATPLMAGIVRALLLGVPLMGAIAIMLDPVRYRVRPGEVLAERWSYVRGFREMWWAFTPLWPGIALAVLAWWQAAFVRPLGVGETLTWWWALGTYLLVLVVGFYCAGIFFAGTETRFDDEGVRCGMGRFLEWENVSQAVVGRRRITLFHREVPGSPMRSVPRGDPAIEGELIRRLNQRGVPIVERAATHLSVLRVLYVGTAAALAAGAWVVRARAGLSEVWLAVGLLITGSMACAALDRLRGFHRLTRVRPMTTTAGSAEAAEALESVLGAPARPPEQADWATKAKRDW